MLSSIKMDKQLPYCMSQERTKGNLLQKSRTTDQMVQAARSGVQNIAEGSVASATSKRTELKLTNVARASLIELHLDYEDFLRQHSCEQWAKDHPLAQEFIRRRISSMEDFRNFIQWAKLQNAVMSVNVGRCPLQSVIAANGALLLLDLTCSLLARQLARIAADFENDSGFSERMHKRRTAYSSSSYFLSLGKICFSLVFFVF